MDHLLNILQDQKDLEKQVNHIKMIYRPIRNIYTENKFGKASFARDAAYSDSKDLSVRTIPDKVFKDRASQIARNCKYDGYQRELASKIYNLFDKKTGLKMSANEQLAEELHNQ